VIFSASLNGPLDQIETQVKQLEALDCDMCHTWELNNDPFLAALRAAEHSARLKIATSVAIALARSPMTTAMTAWELNEFSNGRFILGIGSQIKAHIARRFGMPWSRPAARMREYIQALHAIWDCWEHGERLNFRGEFYRHTLMTPMFTPARPRYGRPPVHLAAVGPLMTRVAGEVADGLIVHGFTTRKYLSEVTLPELKRGLAAAGRSRKDVQITLPLFVVSGLDEQDFADSRKKVAGQLAFYASTPAYEPVLALHGWEEVYRQAHSLSRRGKWDDMAELITDEVLNEFAVVEADPDKIGPRLLQKYGDLVDIWACDWEHPDARGQKRLMSQLQHG
jgi:probable F420-dependent oxidoreductase